MSFKLLVIVGKIMVNIPSKYSHKCLISYTLAALPQNKQIGIGLGPAWLNQVCVSLIRKVTFQWSRWVYSLTSPVSVLNSVLWNSSWMNLLIPMWNVLSLRCFSSRTSSSLVNISVIWGEMSHINPCYGQGPFRGSTDKCLKDIF